MFLSYSYKSIVGWTILNDENIYESKPRHCL